MVSKAKLGRRIQQLRKIKDLKRRSVEIEDFVKEYLEKPGILTKEEKIVMENFIKELENINKEWDKL